MNEMNTGERIAAAAERPRNDIAIVRTPEAIGAEIRNLTQTAKYMTLWYAVEIGRRLVEAKEAVPHGEWLAYLERETEFSSSSASRFMTAFREYGGGDNLNFPTLGNISVSNALRLLAVPEEEREEFAAEVDAEHISAKELEVAIRERDEAKKALQNTEARLEDAQRTISDSDKQLTDLRQRLAAAQEDVRAADDQATENERALKARIQELESRPIDVAVREPDPAEIERRVQEVTEAVRAEKAAAEQRLAEEKEKAKAAADKFKEKLKAAEEKLAGAGAEDRAAAEQLQAEVTALKKQIAMGGEEMVTFKLRFEAWQEAYAAMLRALAALDEEKAAKGKAAIKAVIEKWGAV